MGARLMAIVAEGERGRVYLPPTERMEGRARDAESKWEPEGAFVEDARAFTPHLYGLTQWRDLFTRRQLLAMTTFSDLVQEARQRVKLDAGGVDQSNESNDVASGGTSSAAYADAVSVYLAFSLSKAADRNSSLCVWESSMDRMRGTFGRQAL